MRWRYGAVLVGALSGCGPVAGQADDDGSSGRGPEPTEPTSTLGATMSGATATTGADPDSGSTTSDSAITTTADDDCGESCCSFIVCPDTQPLVECDLWSQNCPRGDKCVPFANDGGDLWNSSRCSTVAGSPDEAGDPCVVTYTGVSGLDSCDLGLVCLWVDPATNMGTCVPLCVGTEANPSCGGDEGACTLAFEGALPVCLPGCDPLAQDCPDGAGCYRGDGDAFVCGRHDRARDPGRPAVRLRLAVWQRRAVHRRGSPSDLRRQCVLYRDLRRDCDRALRARTSLCAALRELYRGVLHDPLSTRESASTPRPRTVLPLRARAPAHSAGAGRVATKRAISRANPSRCATPELATACTIATLMRV